MASPIAIHESLSDRDEDGLGPIGASGYGVMGLGAPRRPSVHGRARSDVFGDALDLADPANRLGSSPDLQSRLEQKRLEHERQREAHKKMFEEQMQALADKQAAEEAELLTTKNLAQSKANQANPIKIPSASVPSTPPSNGSTTSDEETRERHASAGGPPRSRSGGDLGKSSKDLKMTKAKLVNPNGAIGSNVAANGNGARDAMQSQSVPGSRRHSGEQSGSLAEGFNRLNLENVQHPKSASGPTGDAPMLTSFLFDDELDAELHNSAYGGKYLQMNTDDDKFPILVRRDSYPGILSASSAALDLAPLSQTPPRSGFRHHHDSHRHTSEWPQFTDSAPSHHIHGRTVTVGSGSSNQTSVAVDRATSPSVARQLPLPASTPAASMPVLNGTPSGRTSPVTDLSSPIRRSSTGLVAAPGSPDEKRKGVIGMGPGQTPGVARGLPTSDMSNAFNVDPINRSPSNTFNSYGPISPSLGRTDAVNSANPFGYDLGYGGLGGPGPNGLYGSKGPVNDRAAIAESNRFSGLRLEDLQGDMASLCKDQHGCRFLQRKLEEGNPEHRDMIFNEIFPVFFELMVDPFANYLAQRLLEFSSDEQRDTLIESLGPHLVTVSLNIHGTRAIQKLIDFLSTRRQVQALIFALNAHVVTLIKDLNGNHVIQKCLNHLAPEDNQFIYNAVAANCVEVATHRHGCCVLQRCIDHASEAQRIQLVTEITYQSLALVQDAFGNYVVQYIVDVDPRFAEAIVRQFLGSVIQLSCQKFSSNVVEKCIRIADPAGRKLMIEELLERTRLERLLNDPFGNYVLQTCIDYADPTQRVVLINGLRPLLPALRNTPHGKRISQKIAREINGRHDPSGRGGHFHPGMSNGMGGGFGPFGGPGYMGPPPGNQLPPPRNFSNGLHGLGPPPPSASPNQTFNAFGPPPPQGSYLNGFDYPQSTFTTSPFL